MPQWNCGCANCSAARAGRQSGRTQSSVAVSADGERWLLLNCSPDIAGQIERFPPLQPRGLRGTPIDGMLLTDANVDHLGGLAVLRQSGDHRFTIYATPTVADIARAQPAFARFFEPPHRWIPVEAGVPFDAEGLTVRPISVEGTTPGYDGRRRVDGAVVAYEVRHSEDAPVLFAPVFAAIGGELAAAIARAGVAFLDGSFYSDDELTASGMMAKHARDLGHLPVVDTLAFLPTLPKHGRIVFTHVNNSNPMLDPDSEAAAEVRAAGAEIAYDGGGASTSSA